MRSRRGIVYWRGAVGVTTPIEGEQTMTPSTMVRQTITPEAVECIEQLGMQAEFEQMIEYIRQHMSGLRHIQVTLSPPYDTADYDHIVIDALRDPAVQDTEDSTRK